MTKPSKPPRAAIMAAMAHAALAALLLAAAPGRALAEQTDGKAPVGPTILSLVVISVGALIAWWHHKNKNKRK